MKKMEEQYIKNLQEDLIKFSQYLEIYFLSLKFVLFYFSGVH